MQTMSAFRRSAALDAARGASGNPAAGLPEPGQTGLPDQDYPSTVHPLHRYAAAHPAPEPDYHQPSPFAERSISSPIRRVMTMRCTVSWIWTRSNRARPGLFGRSVRLPGRLRRGWRRAGREAGRRHGHGCGRSCAGGFGNRGGVCLSNLCRIAPQRRPPIIKADTGPTKIVPASADANAKVPDRLAAGDGTEKIVPREEAPVDVNAQPAPRMVFPALNQNANPPTVASVAPSGPPPVYAGNGTLPNNEPRKIKTLSVRADRLTAPRASDVAPSSAAKSAAADESHCTVPPAAANANASTANAPMSLSPQTAQSAPAADTHPGRDQHPGANRSGGGGGYLVQVSSQKNEAEAQASYRVLQGKYRRCWGRAARDQARRSRREGGLLPRHGRSVRLARRSLATLRQPGNAGGKMRRPKELTAVSLTLMPSAG